MLKISYAARLGLSVVNLVQFALEMCLAAQNRQKIHKNPYFNVQGHPWSLLSVAIKARVRLPISDCPISHRF